jgi:hypothetical protein
MDPISGLSLGRIVVGVISLLSPGLAAKLMFLDSRANPQLPLMTRAFGSREIALGALTLASTGDDRERMVQAGIAVDAADVLAGVVTAAKGSKLAGLGFAAVAVGAVVTGVRALQD